ncbi:hypothetical protein DMC30DRAFT_403996 [Rhodotorula diobovata]|uniref:Proteophosphoglycan ppg4 n=1 Tax=Rhodotorula diobovata TaxID=5288 RepID=A0A5C5FPE0_9BASI|nr:hypothetical protein DMC30DRAFT_403996 [Rhodotorula diobovata]
MDFLTQSFSPAARVPQAQQATQPEAPTYAEPSSPSTSAAPSAGSPTTTSTTRDRRTSDSASVATSSTFGTAALEQTAAHFAALRTADTAESPTVGLPGEPIVEAPSLARGDWLTYGRVKAQVVLWPEGTVGVKGGKKLREREGDEEWVVEGTLWITKNKEIILVLSHDKPPIHVDRSRARLASLGRRLSGSLGRTVSRESGERVAAPVGSSTSTGDDDAEHEQHKSGFSGFVKKMVSAVTPGGKSSSHGETSGDGVTLTRTRTGERTPRTTTNGEAASATTPQRRQSGDETARHGALTFEEPEKVHSPFPTYKGHPVTALYISSPALINSVRFYPHRKVERSSFGAGSKDAPVSSAPGAAAPKDENGRIPSPSAEDHVLLVQAPVVELDVVDKDKALETVGSEGSKREVTVGFVFKDVLLMKCVSPSFLGRLRNI